MIGRALAVLACLVVSPPLLRAQADALAPVASGLGRWAPWASRALKVGAVLIVVRAASR